MDKEIKERILTCDNCEKTVKYNTTYEEHSVIIKDWMHVKKSTMLPEYKFHWDFCCIKCLVNFMKRRIDE